MDAYQKACFDYIKTLDVKKVFSQVEERDLESVAIKLMSLQSTLPQMENISISPRHSSNHRTTFYCGTRMYYVSYSLKAQRSVA